MIRDRSLKPGQNVSTLPIIFTRGGSAGIPASTTAMVAFPWPRNARIVAIGATVRAKANSDNTVTLTFKTGATTIGTVAFTGGGALSMETAVDVAHAANAALTVDSGALGGTGPSFNDVVIYLILRTGGFDIVN